MNAAKAIITKPQLESLLQAAIDGYTKAYGQQHKTPDGMFCWMGRIDRAYALMAKADGEMAQRKMKKGVDAMINLAQKDFIEGEKAHADYVDACNSLSMTPQDINPDCQCQYCQRVPNGAELLFAKES
jgi:hypothetical protein